MTTTRIPLADLRARCRDLGVQPLIRNGEARVRIAQTTYVAELEPDTG